MKRHDNSGPPDLSGSNFFSLTPDVVFAAVESVGLIPTGQYLQLNSYENRVFDLRLEPEGAPPELAGRVVAKFYRPHRWSMEALLEEHAFLTDLTAGGIPVVAPLPLSSGGTLGQWEGIWFALFPRFLGRMPQELFQDDLESVGRTLARLHNIGAARPARHRLRLDVPTYGHPSLAFLEDWVAPEVWRRYRDAAEAIFAYLGPRLEASQVLRIHGDCHRGNLLHSDRAGQAREFFFVDFDDFCNGPAVQDFWMLLSGAGQSGDVADELSALLSGYEDLRVFDEDELELIPALRGLRIVHYGAWVARRWKDPSFPRLFPQFREYVYWAQETEVLEGLAREIQAGPPPW